MVNDWVYVRDIGWVKITGFDGVLLRYYGEPISYAKEDGEVHFGKDEIIEVESNHE